MKIEELKRLIKTSVREVVREELEYHFNKLYESVGNVSNSTPQSRPAPKGKNAGMINTLTEKYRSSFEDMMNEDMGQDTAYRPQKRMPLKNDNVLTRTVFHDTKPLEHEDDNSVNSILDEQNVRTLARSEKTKGVYNAITRDYTDLIKAMS